MKAKLEDFWQKLNIAQAIVVVAAIAGVVCMAIFVPPDVWARVDWKFWVGAVLAALGASSPFLDKLISAERRDTQPPAPSRPKTIRGDIPAPPAPTPLTAPPQTHDAEKPS